MARVKYQRTAVDGAGNGTASTQVEVRDLAGDLATLYENQTGSTQAYSGSNPFNSGDGDPDDEGFFEFWVEEGTYTVEIGTGTSAKTYREELHPAYTTYKNVTNLLASTESIPEGTIVTTDEDNFSYEVAASGASDEHVTTSGGVKLYVLPQDSVYNLAAFNVDLTGATDSTAQVQKAMDAATGGGIVFHPGGTIRATNIDGKKDVTLDGIGDASLFVRTVADGSTGDRTMFDWGTGESINVTVRNVALDLRTDSTATGSDLEQGGSGDFAVGLDFADFSESSDPLTEAEAEAKRNNIVIENCYLFNSNKASSGNWTTTGITVRGCNDVIIQGNRCDGVQIKAAGSTVSSYRVSVLDNQIKDAQAYAVSAVVKEAASGQRNLKDVIIANNVASGNGTRAPALYTGVDDGDGGTVLCRNIQIVDNSIHMVWANATDDPNFAFVLHRGGSDGTDEAVLVAGNTCTDDGTASSEANGISVSGSSVVVSGNIVNSNCGLHAISVIGSDSVVTNNRISGANRGIEFNFLTDGIAVAKGNTLYGGGTNTLKIEVDGDSHSVTLDLTGNTIIDSLVESGDFSQQPFRFVLDGGSFDGVVSGNTVVDLGNTAHSIDEQDRGTSTFDIIYANNYFGPPALAKRQQTPFENFYLNTGAYASRGPIVGEVDFRDRVTIRAALALSDGITAPATDSGYASIYVDDADGDLKVKFGDGTVKTIVTDT